MKRLLVRLLIVLIVSGFAYVSSQLGEFNPPAPVVVAPGPVVEDSAATVPQAPVLEPSASPPSTPAARPTSAPVPQSPAGNLSATAAPAPQTGADRPASEKSTGRQTGSEKATSQPPRATKSTGGNSSLPRTAVENMTIRDLDGKVVHRGNVDLAETLRRIDAGRKLSFPNDGSVFQNRERRLPRQASGYYREWVHPTPALSGPGPQRVVTGEQGEAWYTPDHYRTFHRLR